MRFDTKTRIEHLIEIYREGGLREDEKIALIEELGEDGYNRIEEIVSGIDIFDERDLDAIKKSALAAKKEKTIQPLFVNDNYFFELFSDQDFSELMEYQLDKNLIDQTVDVDETILNLLRGATTEKYIDKQGKEVVIKGSPYAARQPELMKMVRTYVRGGYNIYPLMRKMNETYIELSQKEKQDPDFQQQRIMCGKCQALIEQAEVFSPYKPVFSAAERLGELIEEEKARMKEGNYEGIEELQEKIDLYREKLSAVITSGDYDIEELAQVVDGKRHYLQESEPGFNYQSGNYAMYTGLLEAKKCTASIIKQQEAGQDQE